MMADNIEKRVGDLETKVGTIEAKMDAFIQSNEEFKREMRETMSDFKAEMRQQNEMRAAEIRELRQAQATQQARHDQSMEQLRQDVKDISKEVRNLFFAFVGIIVAIMVGMFWTR